MVGLGMILFFELEVKKVLQDKLISLSTSDPV